MKKIIKIAIVCSFLFGIAPIFAEKSKVGFRYPRSFKAYISEKYKDLKKTPTPVQINKPRYRVSAGSFPDKVETNTDTSTTKKFANPAYERSTRSQVQRAGIFCRFVENRTADSDCIKTINTNNPKKKHYRRAYQEVCLVRQGLRASILSFCCN